MKIKEKKRKGLLLSSFYTCLMVEADSCLIYGFHKVVKISGFLDVFINMKVVGGQSERIDTRNHFFPFFPTEQGKL